MSSDFGRPGRSGTDATRAPGLILSLAKPEGNPPQLDRAIRLGKYERLFRLKFVSPRHPATLSGCFELTIEKKREAEAKCRGLNL